MAWATDYFEAALAPADRARVEAHLAECPPCLAYLEQLRQTVRLTGLLTPREASDAALDRLLQLFRDWRADLA